MRNDSQGLSPCLRLRNLQTRCSPRRGAETNRIANTLPQPIARTIVQGLHETEPQNRREFRGSFVAHAEFLHTRRTSIDCKSPRGLNLNRNPSHPEIRPLQICSGNSPVAWDAGEARCGRSTNANGRRWGRCFWDVHEIAQRLTRKDHLR